MTLELYVNWPQPFVLLSFTLLLLKTSTLKPLVERKISLILHLATVMYPVSSGLLIFAIFRVLS
jgi:hypothetical protein